MNCFLYIALFLTCRRLWIIQPHVLTNNQCKIKSVYRLKPKLRAKVAPDQWALRLWWSRYPPMAGLIQCSHKPTGFKPLICVFVSRLDQNRSEGLLVGKLHRTVWSNPVPKPWVSIKKNFSEISGQECTGEEQCGWNAYCNKGTCDCIPTYQLTQNGRDCFDSKHLNILQIQSSRSELCYIGTICKGRVCLKYSLGNDTLSKLIIWFKMEFQPEFAALDCQCNSKL